MSESLLGINGEINEKVFLPQSIRPAAVYIGGVPGTGKSGLMENMILQDIQQGLGVGVFDPHGTLIDNVVKRCEKRLKDIIVLDLNDSTYTFGLNLFQSANPADPREIQDRVSAIVKIFSRLFSTGRAEAPRLSQYLRNFSHVLIKNQLTLVEMQRLFLDETYRQKALQAVEDRNVKLFFENYSRLKPSEREERADSTVNKLDELLLDNIRNIIGQRVSTIDLRRIMDERKILLIKFNARTNDILTLMGALFLAEIVEAGFRRIPNKKGQYAQWNLYLDEFPTYATEDFGLIITQLRKFCVAPTYAHQSLNQAGMDEELLASALTASTKIVFRMGGQDADALINEFDIKIPPPIQVGTRPILTPPQDTISHLLRAGHHNPEHKMFVQDYLIPMQDIIDRRIATFNGLSNVPIELNRFLYEVQTTHAVGLHIPEIIIFAFSDMGVGKTRNYSDPTWVPPYYYSHFWHRLSDDEKHRAGLPNPEFSVFIQSIWWKRGGQEDQIHDFCHFIDALRRLMYVLAYEPILVNSGQVEAVYGTPRTFQDVANEYKLRLANLPNFTAFIKMTETEKNKTTFATIKIPNPDEMFPVVWDVVKKEPPAQVLKRKLAEIKEQNIRDGYLRSIDEVRKEIDARWDELPTPIRKTIL